MFANHTVRDFNGGVSQQVSESRFDNQVESMENYMVTVAKGLRRRNPLTLVSAIGSINQNMAIHSYDRGDGQEKYGMIFDANGLRVFDENGVAKTVADISAVGEEILTVWAGTDWKKDIGFLTVGDTTWILNKSIVANTNGALTPTDTSTSTAFYWIKRSFSDGTSGLGHGYTYQITLSDIGTISYNHTDSILAAAGLVALINGISGYTSRNEGSIVYISRDYSITSTLYTGNPYYFTTNPDGLYATLKYATVKTLSTGAITGYDISVLATYNDLINKLILGTHSIYIRVTSTMLRTWWTGINIKNNPSDFFVALSETEWTTTPNQFSTPKWAFVGTGTWGITGGFEMSAGDSWGNQASVGWETGVAKITDLPASMAGFTNAEVGTISITGTDKDSFTNYYLKWQDDHWKETVKEGVEYKIDYKTMPAKLVRQTNGTFALGWNTEYATDGFDTIWGERNKGDNDSNPLPSFIGNTISNMFFFKNRLGFTSDENIILSETASYYNFFSTTAIEILDSDPIDAAVDSDTVSIIRNINTVAGSLTLWADNGQFMLSSADVLSPATTRISQTSSYATENSLSPVVVDNGIIFFNKIGNYLDVLSYDPASLQSDKSSAESISSHVPEYIPRTVDTVKVSSAHNMVFISDSSDLHTIYVYKYHINGGQKVISAWFKWTFTISIYSMEILDGVLYLMASNNSAYKVALEPIVITSNFNDADTSLPFTSSVVMSEYNVELTNEIRATNEPFYMKNIKVGYSGTLDLDIINIERGATDTISNFDSDRKVFIGGNSDNTRIGFSTSGSTGCELNNVSIDGSFKIRSRNI